MSLVVCSWWVGGCGGAVVSDLPQEDVAFVDEYAARTEAESRSAVIHAAIELLRQAQLEQEYTEAFAGWDASEDAALWERTSGDGITDEAW